MILIGRWRVFRFQRRAKANIAQSSASRVVRRARLALEPRIVEREAERREEEGRGWERCEEEGETLAERRGD